ncbi:hypothetical protein K466DRAFT_585529 [Polyporus arcularius HHB13444]|uniref:Uncharacterized protein n=1 Tax=Polyporus arcularius HHB13444 TaxID=1314778 RepID=A0A5C3PGQ3_9APHY|nr:hypothetical protein K466DRAFT_585529 [Polyporus arcularius HHB13444]
MLLTPMTGASFQNYMWTLKPTQKPDGYIYTGYETIGGLLDGDVVTGSDDMELPNREFILVHAAI